ncbi:hypothetical protein CT3_03140 [Comamonas terrigena NBRC 13299]|nr:hypothetical protein CT3_03140 [Comamonas terrigena NBRC 13299]
MVIGTPLSIFLVPIFFIGVFKLFGQKLDQDKTPPASTAAVTDGGSHHD